MGIYDIWGNDLLPENKIKTNCKIIAHRGYHVNAAQNTIEAFKEAAEAGFDWIEIDIRKTEDGIYVMSHDASVTLYNSGTATTVNIGNSNYSTIKNYTWDSAGKYKLCTLQAVFNAMKLYDMKMICDRKSGTNAEIMEIAAMCGAVDSVVLSYGSYATALADSELLKKYDNVPVRIWSTDNTYSSYLQLKDEIANPIYADVNATGVTADTSLSVHQACGVPIIFSGCTTANVAIWQVLASGVMANLNLNISHEQFIDYLNVDYDLASNITPSADSASVTVNGTANITASSDVSTPGGYVYGYTTDPTIATVIQKTFGQSASFTITGKTAGSTVLRLFTGSGTIVNIPVTVT